MCLQSHQLNEMRSTQLISLDWSTGIASEYLNRTILNSELTPPSSTTLPQTPPGAQLFRGVNIPDYDYACNDPQQYNDIQPGRCQVPGVLEVRIRLLAVSMNAFLPFCKLWYHGLCISPVFLISVLPTSDDWPCSHATYTNCNNMVCNGNIHMLSAWRAPCPPPIQRSDTDNCM